MNHDFPTNYVEEALASSIENPSKNDLKGSRNAFGTLPPTLPLTLPQPHLKRAPRRSVAEALGGMVKEGLSFDRPKIGGVGVETVVDEFICMKSIPEIAQSLGITEGQVVNALRYAFLFNERIWIDATTAMKVISRYYNHDTLKITPK
jgi:hypothetical protein